MTDQRPRPGQPRWQPPGTPIPTPADKPVKPPRDYIGPALAALGAPLGTSVVQNQSLISAIIIAQALDRFGERVVEASAIGNYKRTS